MENKGVLSGVRVLDLSRVLAGPFCTMMLADMGAEVIKVEIPDIGDDSRAFPPFIEGESVYFKNMNRNKKGITLNLKDEDGRKLFMNLVKKCDILIENFRPGTMEKLGLGWETLKKAHPGLIYGCVSGFGHTGPYSNRAGYDIIGQAMSGVMSVTGTPETGELRCGAPISDVMAGISLCSGVLAALYSGKQTGIGEKVDIALVDTLVAALQIINQIYLATDRLPNRTGNRYESTYPYDTFLTKDGQNIVIGCANDKFWGILCKLMERPELIEHPQMDTNMKRVQNHAKIRSIVEAWTLTQESGPLLDMLTEKGFPACPIYNLEQVSKDPQIAGNRQMFVEADYPRIGKLKITNSHIKMSNTHPGFRTPSPDLGQHNEDVYSGLLGLSIEDINTLKEKKII